MSFRPVDSYAAKKNHEERQSARLTLHYHHVTNQKETGHEEISHRDWQVHGCCQMNDSQGPLVPESGHRNVSSLNRSPAPERPVHPVHLDDMRKAQASDEDEEGAVRGVGIEHGVRPQPEEHAKQ